MRTIKTIMILCCISISINAQIPNADFENWIDDFTPNDWTTTNFLSAWTNVSKSTDSHTGASAVRLEVASFNGIPLYPSLNITFKVNQAYGSLNGYYKLQQNNNDVILVVLSSYFANGNIIGASTSEFNTSSSSYLPFSLNLDAGSTIPDSIFIQMTVLTNNDSIPGFGAYVLVDNLTFGAITDVEHIKQIPSEFSLKQNYPNPFNPSTVIEFSIPTELFVELKVFNILGAEVETLVNDIYAPGTYKADFHGAYLPSGLYFARISAGNFVETKKMILTK